MTEEEVAYRMPKVGVGAAVRIFPNGNPSEPPTMAFVARCNDRSIAAKNTLGQVYGAARHISDPVLKSRDDAFRRDCGAWDFVEERGFSEFSHALQALEKRVKTLEELLDKKTK